MLRERAKSIMCSRHQATTVEDYDRSVKCGHCHVTILAFNGNISCKELWIKSLWHDLDISLQCPQRNAVARSVQFDYGLKATELFCPLRD